MSIGVEEAQRILINVARGGGTRSANYAYEIISESDMAFYRGLVMNKQEYKHGKISREEYLAVVKSALPRLRQIDQNNASSFTRRESGFGSGGVTQYRPIGYVPTLTDNGNVDFPHTRSINTGQASKWKGSERVRLAGKGKALSILGKKHLATMGFKRSSWSPSGIQIAGFGYKRVDTASKTTIAYMQKANKAGWIPITPLTTDRIALLAYSAFNQNTTLPGVMPMIKRNPAFDPTKSIERYGSASFRYTPDTLKSDEMIKVVCGKNGVCRWAVVKKVGAGKGMSGNLRQKKNSRMNEFNRLTAEALSARADPSSMAPGSSSGNGMGQ